MSRKRSHSVGGRPKGSKGKKTIEAEMMRERLRQKVFKEFDPIVEAQIDLARGHLVQVITREGEKIYSKSPDKGAAELLLSHSIGKPKETVEIQEKHILHLDA